MIHKSAQQQFNHSSTVVDQIRTQGTEKIKTERAQAPPPQTRGDNMYGNSEPTVTVELTHLDLDAALVAITGAWMLMSDVAKTSVAQAELAATLEDLHPYLSFAHGATTVAGEDSSRELELTQSDIDALTYALNEISSPALDPNVVASLLTHLMLAATFHAS
jgi:hypothetical protein